MSTYLYFCMALDCLRMYLCLNICNQFRKADNMNKSIIAFKREATLVNLRK